jgi:hypothetical protein
MMDALGQLFTSDVLHVILPLALTLLVTIVGLRLASIVFSEAEWRINTV